MRKERERENTSKFHATSPLRETDDDDHFHEKSPLRGWFARSVVVGCVSSMATREFYEPTARLNPAFISTQRHLYLWGGRTVAFETGSEDARIQQARCIEQFDPYLEVWRQLNTTGTPHRGLDGAACTSVADQLYMYGGVGKRREGVLSLLNLKTLTWSQLCQEATAGGPMRKADCGMVSFHGDQLAVIGGYGFPTGPTQHGASFIKSTKVTDGVGWTNEVHVFNINKGIYSVIVVHIFNSSYM